MLRRLELLAALLILVSSALPFGSCTIYRDAEGKEVWIPLGEVKGPLVAEDLVLRPLAGFDPLDAESYLFQGAFVWPVLFAGIFTRWPRMRSVRTLRLLQLPLAFGSAYVFWLFGLVRPLLGFYVASSALALYAVVWALDVRNHWRRLRAAPA